jgi:hypothetical protein
MQNTSRPVSKDSTLKVLLKSFLNFFKIGPNIIESFLVGTIWTPHKVELAVWTHYILRDLKPELLIDMPEASAVPAAPAATDEEAAAVVNNGQLLDPNGEDTKSSLASSVGDEDSNAAKNFTASENEESQEAVAAPQEAAAAPTTETSTNNGNGENVAEVSVPVAEDLSVPVVEVSVPAVKEAPVEAAPVAVVTPEEEVPKTNGNSSAAASSPHSNGSAENNGNGNDEASKAKASSEADLLPKPNGELENGVVSYLLFVCLSNVAERRGDNWEDTNCHFSIFAFTALQLTATFEHSTDYSTCCNFGHLYKIICFL